jgi:hypothetical protein
MNTDSPHEHSEFINQGKLKDCGIIKRKEKNYIYFYLYYFNNSYNNVSCISASYIPSLIFSPLRSETK